MLLSLSRRFIFVHTAKTGGQSVHRALEPYCTQPAKHPVNRLLQCHGIRVNHFGPVHIRRFRLHTPALQIRNHLPSEVFDSSFKFGFVRNPWDRMVSYYHYLMEHPKHHRHRKVAEQGGFKAYLRYELSRGKVLQKPMLTDREGNLIVDFVGRVEHMHDEFAKISERLGLSVQLKHLNRSAHRDYRECYDDESIEFVREHLREDVEFFGYDFDGLLDEKPLLRVA